MAVAESSPIDDRGRFSVDPRFRKMLGARVVQIWTPHGILLRPVRGKLSKAPLPAALEADGDALYWDDEARGKGRS